MSDRFRIGAVPDLFAQPLFHSFLRSPGAPGELSFDAPAVHLQRLMEKDLDAAFISPLEYALNSSDLAVLPDIGVSSAGMSAIARLYFRGEMSAIQSMAVGQVTAIDVVLARLVLGEKYDSAPDIRPAAGPLDRLFEKAECALVAGDELLTLTTDFPFIDLVDEWTDITEAPFVHSLCVVRNDSYRKDLHDALRTAQEEGRRDLKNVAGVQAAQRRIPADTVYAHLAHLTYGLDDDARTALSEFFRMAYYYGMLNDIPDLTVAA